MEVLAFRVDPGDVEHFLAVDHEVWTLGEADTPGVDGIPFLSKEVWLDAQRPGEITIVIEWPSMAAWNAVDDPTFQQQLAERFDERFARPYEIVRGAADAKQLGIIRWSRFEPDDRPTDD